MYVVANRTILGLLLALAAMAMGACSSADIAAPTDPASAPTTVIGAPTTAPVVVEPDMAPTPDPDAERVAQLIAAVEADGFVVEAGADGEVEDFAELVQFVAGASTPWYFVSVIERPASDFTIRLREQIRPEGNVITYWNDEITFGTQVATDRFDQEDPAPAGPLPAGLTPAFLMRVIVTSVDPLATPPSSDETIAQLLSPYPGVAGTIEGDKIVLTGEVSTFQERAAAEASILFPIPIENRIVVIHADLDETLSPYPNVSADVVNNVVILTGSVDSNAEWTEVGRLVREISELGVRNEVTIDPQGTTLLDLINFQPELSTLRSLIDEAGLASELSGPGPMTLFAPTNDAFVSLGPALDAIRSDSDGLRQFLLGHMIPTASTLAVLAGKSHPTLAPALSISVESTGGSSTVNGSTFVLVSATAANGKMHIVGQALIG